MDNLTYNSSSSDLKIILPSINELGKSPTSTNREL